jgi:hypothetical protein
MLLHSPQSDNEAPETFEIIGPQDLPGVDLHENGDFSICGKRFQDTETAILAAIVPPWTISRSQGDKGELLLVSLATGAKHSLRFQNGQWMRRLYWQPLESDFLFEALYFLPREVRLLPTLHQLGPRDSVAVEIATPVGVLAIEQTARTDGFLCVELPSGETRRFGTLENCWCEIVPSQHDVHSVSRAEKATVPIFDSSVPRTEKSWVPPEDPRFLAEPGRTKGRIAVSDRPHVEFGDQGELVVQNRTFPAGHPVALDFRQLFIRRIQDLVQIDVNDARDEARWHSDLFRFTASGWERLVASDPHLDAWNKHGRPIAYLVLPPLLLIAAVALMSILFDLFPALERFADFLLP